MTLDGETLKPLRILHLEDNALDGELVHSMLDQEGIECSIQRVETREAFEAAIGQGCFDLIISDFTLPAYDGLTALVYSRAQCPDVGFIFVSGTIGEEIAVDTLKQGAIDYILKDRISRLPAAVRRAVREARDRASRKLADIRLREQAELLDKATDAIIVHDLAGHITYWNRAAEKIYGWTADGILGKRAAELIQAPDAEAEEEGLRRVVLETGEWSGELRQVSRNGESIIMASRRTLLRDDGGKPIAILEINTDITERKQLEAQLLRSQRLESLGALAGGIAHDLNNVLSPIVMAADLLDGNALDEVGRKMVSTIKASASHGSQLVRQILSFARGTSAAPVQLKIDHIISEITRLVEDTLPRSIRVQTHVLSRLPPIVGNPTQLHQVLLNLCVNARDAMPVGGVLTLEASLVEVVNRHTRFQPKPVSGNFVTVTVTDTGMGIPEDHIGRIFEPFFTTKEAGRGTGLGLSTVRKILEQHGGFIEVTSELGRGTTFQVYLPATSEKEAEAEPPPAPDLPAGHGELILLVEDELAVREMTKEMLESFRYRVFTAANGNEALSLYRRHQNEIDLVITDLMMPVMPGQELIRAIVELHPKIPIIPISGLPPEDVGPSLAPHIAGHLIEKPFTAELLLTKVRQALSHDTTD